MQSLKKTIDKHHKHVHELRSAHGGEEMNSKNHHQHIHALLGDKSGPRRGRQNHHQHVHVVRSEAQSMMNQSEAATCGGCKNNCPLTNPKCEIGMKKASNQGELKCHQ